jgi:hypothetical protein
MPTFRLTARRLRLIAVLLLMGSPSGYALGHQLNRALHDASPVPPAISHVQTASGRLGAPTPTPPAGAGPSHAAPPIVYRLVSRTVPAPATNAPRLSEATTGQVPASSLPAQSAAPTHGDAKMKQDHAHNDHDHDRGHEHGQDQGRGHEHNADHDHDKPPDNTKASGHSGHDGEGSSSGPNAPDASNTPTAATAPVVPTATNVPRPPAQPQSNPRQRQGTPSGQSGVGSTRGQATFW